VGGCACERHSAGSKRAKRRFRKSIGIDSKPMNFDEFRRRNQGRHSNDNGPSDSRASATADDTNHLPRDIRHLVARMTSKKKIAANRSNAKKSTGPKSVRGKALARFNALKFGTFAAQRLISGEDENEYQQLAARVSAELKPAAVVEAMLVDQIIGDLWRLKRIECAEPIYFEHVRHSMMTRLLRSMSDSDLGLSLREFEFTIQLQDGEPPIGAERNPETRPSSPNVSHVEIRQGRHATVNARRYAAESTSFLRQEIERVDRPEMVVLEGIAPSDREIPFMHIDRIRRALVRDILQKLSSLCDVQACRNTVESPFRR
jgi:hypothetical protein